MSERTEMFLINCCRAFAWIFALTVAGFHLWSPLITGG